MPISGHASWLGAPPKDAFIIPKFKGEPGELPFTGSLMKKVRLFFDSHPYFSEPGTWRHRRASLALIAFPTGSAPSGLKVDLIQIYDELVREFKDSLESCGSELLTLEEKWQPARQRGIDTVSPFFTFCCIGYGVKSLTRWCH